MIHVVEAISAAQMKKFALFPIKLYKKNPYYVPSFTSDEKNIKNEKVNFAAKGCDVKCFLAYRDGKIVGRIAAIIVREANEKYGEKKVRFSRFDFIDDEEVAAALLNAVIGYGKECGMDTVHGPWGFNDTDREGMLTSGFDQISTFATNYNYEYYPEIMKKLGYEKESEWVEYRFEIKNYDERYSKIGEAVAKRSCFKEIAGTMPLKRLIRDYGDKFFDCYNAAYGNLDSYIEIKGDAKKSVLKTFASVINDKYLSFIIDEKTDKVAAFGVAIPALGYIINKHKGSALKSLIGIIKEIKKPHALELCLVGVAPEYRMSGINAMIIDRIWRNVLKYGITDIVSNPMLTTNVNILAQWKNIPHEIVKRRQTFIKKF